MNIFLILSYSLAFSDLIMISIIMKYFASKFEYLINKYRETKKMNKYLEEKYHEEHIDWIRC